MVMVCCEVGWMGRGSIKVLGSGRGVLRPSGQERSGGRWMQRGIGKGRVGSSTPGSMVSSEVG